MELVMIILVIGVVFWINQPSMDNEKLQKLIETIDRELDKEFKKRDDKIKELENEIKRIEDRAKKRIAES